MIDLGTAARKYKNEKVKIGFYNASITNLNGFKYGKQECEQCKQERKLFTLNPNPYASPDWICIECLTSIKIETTHNTDLGFVAPNLPEGIDDARKHVPEASYQEMIKTPPFLSIQGEQWLSHCNDFMDYIGTWEAPDFTEKSKDGNGKSLFCEMTHEDYWHLWEECGLAENENKYTWQDCLYHTFECWHCKIKKGYWEIM